MMQMMPPAPLNANGGAPSSNSLVEGRELIEQRNGTDRSD
jgi:hypothetical protein